MMTRKGVFVILAAMAASRQFAYEIRLEPDAAKRRTVSILKSQGPETAMLYLYAPAPWVIAGSAITAQDDNLWSGFNTTPNNYCHIYRMVSARSSQQYVTVFGQLTQPGDGYGINPWFKATVPAVDIDWVNHSGTGHEDDEDAWTGFCPLTKVQDQRTKVIVRKLKDDRSLVSASMTLECWPTTAARFLKEDGVTALWSGATVSDLETPLTLYVDPQASGPFTVTLKGPSDDAFNRPTDYLSGKAVLLDLDVDADNNGAINDTDDPLEEDPGGILASGAVKQVCMKLEPSGLTGKLTLTAVSGGSLIRVWQDAGKSTPVALPAEWDLSGGYTFPTTVYVEGVAASSAARDVQLRLRYTEAEGQYTDDIIKLTIIAASLKSIEFTSDHNLLRKDPTSGSLWGDSSTDYETPEWVAGSRSNPISQTKDSKIIAKVKIKVEPVGTNFELIGDGPDGYMDFHKTGQTSTGTDQDVMVTADSNLPDQVCTLNKSVNWKIKAGELECSTSASSSHTIYVTYGTPAGSVVTERRVREVCTTANGKSSLGDCADAVFSNLTGAFNLDGATMGPSPIWLLHGKRPANHVYTFCNG